MTGKFLDLLLRHSVRITAIGITVAMFLVARLPELSAEDRRELASTFSFKTFTLQQTGEATHSIRDVNSTLRKIDGWISSVGAAIALNDIDGDGLANDLCLVDPRNDRVYVATVPGTGNRYLPIELNPNLLPYDATTMSPMGCLPGDLNEDGRMDLLVYYWGRGPIAFLSTTQPNDYRPREILNKSVRWFTNAATLADLDGDGHIDLLVANYFQDGARVLDSKTAESGKMQHSMSRAYNAGGTYFFLWDSGEGGKNPSVRYNLVDPGLDSNVANAWTLAVGAQDLDGDLLPELYFANDFGPDRLLHNGSSPGRLVFELVEGSRTLTTPASKVLGKDSFKGMGLDFADLNGDGIPDLFVSNITAEYALEESNLLFISNSKLKTALQTGLAPYEDQSESMGVSRSDWSWDVKFADLNNDGVQEILQATGFLKGQTDRWPELQELAMGNDELLQHPSFWPHLSAGDDISGHVHNFFFARAADGRYYDIAAELGLDDPHVTRGISTADVDGDGDLDIAIANQWEDSYFYRNDCPDCGAALVVIPRFSTGLRGETPIFYEGSPRKLGSPAIGAKVSVTTSSGLMLTAQVDGGNGHSGKRSQELHFGLGRQLIEKVEVVLEWRDRMGNVHKQTRRLAPGRYTIDLPSGSSDHAARPSNKTATALLDDH